MLLTTSHIRRVEVWSDLACASGSRRVVVRDVMGVAASASVDGQAVLRLLLPLTAAGLGELVEGAVVRVDQSDSAFDEWRIVDVLTDTGARTVQVVAEPVSVAALSGLVSSVDGLGVRRFDFDLVALTPAAIIDAYVLPALSGAGMTWWARGTVDSSAPVNLTVSWDSPLALLKALADASGLELQVRRNGTTGYYVDLLTRIGSGAATADLRYRKNLMTVRRTSSARGQATRVFPRGGQLDGYHATMGRNLWRVVGVTGSTVSLADPAGGAGPVLREAQLVGLHLRKVDGTTTHISGAFAASQAVDVASVTGIAAGDLVSIVQSDGTELTYLDDPTQTAAYGVISGVLDAPDVPPTENVVPNPAARTWPGALPDGWALVGAPTVTKETGATFTRIGGQSLKVVAAAAGAGVVSPYGRVRPSTAAPYGSGFATICVASGQVRVELVIAKADASTVVLPAFPNIASSSFVAAWEDLGVSGEDLAALGAVQIAVRVLAHGGAATFYVDAVQATQTASQMPFVEGAGATKLWQRANDRLRLYASPVLTFDVALVDLAAVDGTAYPETALTLGADARITDTRLAATFATRIVSIERDYLVPGNTRIALSTKPEDLTGSLARAARAPRQPVAPGEPAGAEYPAGPKPVAPVMVATIDATGRVSVTVTGDEATASVRLAVSKTGTPADATVRAEAAQAGRIVSYANVVTLNQGERAYFAAFGYTDAAGTTSESVKATAQEARAAGNALEGTTRHGAAAIVFPVTLANTPAIRLWGGILHEPRAKWGATGSGAETGAYSSTLPTYEDMVALNASAAGFTPRARLRQKSGATPRAHDFGASNDLDTVGETVTVTLANAPANNDTYTVHYSVALTIQKTSGFEYEVEVIVAIDTNDGTGWVERAAFSYSALAAGSGAVSISHTHEAKPVTVSGLDATDQVRLRLKAITSSGSGTITDLAVHGFDGTSDPDSGVTYQTSADNFASKTPDADDVVYWQAIPLD